MARHGSAGDETGTVPAPSSTVPVVLLHGQPGGRRGWQRVMDELGSGFAVVADDRPGYGASSSLGPMGLAGNADAVRARLDLLGVESAVVVGHSWGGGVALALAERHPERVSGLVLLASIGPGAVTPVDRVMAAPLLGELMAWSAFGLGGPVVRAWLQRADLLDVTVGSTPGAPLWRTFLAEQRAMVNELPAVVAELDSIRAPTIVVNGDADRVVGLPVARALADAIPGAELQVVAGAGHALPWRSPDAVAAAITTAFVRSTRP